MRGELINSRAIFLQTELEFISCEIKRLRSC